MTPEQQAAYIISQSACAVIEMEGMKAANKQREQQGYSIAHDEQSFMDVIDRYGISHNAVVGMCQI